MYQDSVVYGVGREIMPGHTKVSLHALLHPFDFNKEKTTMKVLKLTRILIFLSLISLFIFLGAKSVVKYWRQPLSTDISSSFGDKDNGIQFPLVTLCQYKFPAHNSILNKRSNNSDHFMSAIFDCLKNDKKFQIDDFMESLQIQRRNVVNSAMIRDGFKQIDLSHLDELAWSRVFHKRYGLCFTYDLSQSDKFKFVQYHGTSRPGLYLTLDDNRPWESITIFLHSKNDLPDASNLNGFFYADISRNNNVQHKLELRKKISKRESTRKIPCTQYEQETCENIEDNILVLDKFNCKIPILYHGQHLNEFISQEIMNCSNGVTYQALNLIPEKTSQCNFTQTCQNTRFTAKYVTRPTWIGNKSFITVLFDNPEVMHYNTYIIYDFLSLIGEVGGLLGLTMGASALSLLESLLKRIENPLS